jgi:hypothetical protein
VSWLDDVLGKSIALLGAIVNPRRGTLNFVGTGITVTDNPTGDSTDVDFSGLSPIWVSFTPTFTAGGGSPAIGDGSILGKYRIVGDSIEVNIILTVGSTTNLGTGELRFNMPGDFLIDSTKLPDGARVSGVAWITDASSGANNRSGYVVSTNADFSFAVYPTGTGSVMSSTVPFTFAVGDTIGIQAVAPLSAGG